MKKLSVLLITVAIGFPSSVGVTEICATKFDQAWAKRVMEITRYNKAHPEVVKRRNLDRDMSAITRSARERLRKRIALVCEYEAYYARDILHTHGGVVGIEDGPPIVEDLQLPSTNTPDVIPEILKAVIPHEDYPDYENTTRNPMVAGEYGPYTGFSGWYGGGIAGNPGGGNSVVPVASTPEPSTLVMSLGPMLVFWCCGKRLK